MNNSGRFSILFVCMGNICRSPSAEFVFAQRLQSHDWVSQLDWDSAGTHGYHVGGKADPRTIEAARKRGVDLTPHRARQLQNDDFDAYDLLIAMDKANLAKMKALCPPEYQHKLSLMMDWASETSLGQSYQEVPDPYYDGQNAFDLVLDLVESASDGLIAKLPALMEAARLSVK
jgi:protein-tyrosine phosphatase